jgi:hypothetical protein
MKLTAVLNAPTTKVMVVEEKEKGSMLQKKGEVSDKKLAIANQIP